MSLTIMQGHYVKARNDYFSAYLEKIEIIKSSELDGEG